MEAVGGVVPEGAEVRGEPLAGRPTSDGGRPLPLEDAARCQPSPVADEEEVCGANHGGAGF